jgi:hypothetical protein
MKISTKSDGSTQSCVIENCKIFDENNFQCLTEREAIYLKDFFDLGLIFTFVVSNGKWERTRDAQLIRRIEGMKTNL